MNGNLSRNRTNQNIQVYVRLRPINERERMIRSTEVVTVPTNREVFVKSWNDSKGTKKFTFDRTFGPESKQSDVYQSVVHPLIEEVLCGYNCTVFAYGQTGTGKTHTMIGEEVPSIGTSWDDSSELGIIPRALSHLFEELRLMEVEFSMRISFLELYNEELSDLLSSSDATQIRIYDDANKKGSIIVQGLEEIPVHSTADVYKLLAKGQEKRKTASTLMNAQSSRSHTIFSILVHIKENGIDGEELVKIGKLNLVDLAGSENVSKAGNEKGIRTRESVNINQSLLTLGRVITALVERTPHIPYRESKLTRLLQESLGGRTKTSIIATISPGCKDAEETLSTLEYAHRAKNIQNKPEINQKLFKKTVLKTYTEEIDRLKRDLMAARDKNGIYLPDETYNEMQYRIDTQNRELSEKMMLMKALKDEMASKMRLFNEVSLNLVEKTEELCVAESNLSNTRAELGETKNVLHSTRRKYQEKRELLKNYVNTEEILTTQATELLNVADTASADTYRLHESIERRTQSNQQLVSVCEKFTNILDTNLTAINGQVNELQAKNEAHTQLIHRDIFNSKLQNDTFSNDALLNIKLLIELNQTSHDDFVEFLGIDRSEFQQLTNEQQTIVQKMLNSVVEKKETFIGCLNNEFASLTKALDGQKEMLCQHNLNIIQKINQMSIDLNTFCYRQTSTLNTFASEIRQNIERNRLILNESIVKYDSHNTELFNVESELTNLLKKIQNLRTDSEANNHIVKDAVSNLSNVERMIFEKNENITHDIAMDQASFEEKSVDFVASVAKQKNDYFECAEKDQKNFQLTANLVVDHINSLTDDLILTATNINKQIEKTQTYQQQMSEKLQKIEQKCYDETLENSNILVGKIMNENERQSSYAGEAVSVNHGTEEIVNNYCSLAKETITKCRTNIESFRMNDVRSYDSTGETPAKRLFNYPTSFVATSPHERIIKRFWNNLNRNTDPNSSIQFSELDENTLFDNSIDISSIASTSNVLCQNESIPLQEKPLNIMNNSDVTLKPIENVMNMDYFAASNNKDNNKENSRDIDKSKRISSNQGQ